MKGILRGPPFNGVLSFSFKAVERENTGNCKGTLFFNGVLSFFFKADEKGK